MKKLLNFSVQYSKILIWRIVSPFVWKEGKRSKMEINFAHPLFLVFYFMVGAMLLLALIRWFLSFRTELRYINLEIGRSVGAEKRAWQRKKKQLWLSLIPLVQRKK